MDQKNSSPVSAPLSIPTNKSNKKLIIGVASDNPVKINAVRLAANEIQAYFQQIFQQTTENNLIHSQPTSQAINRTNQIAFTDWLNRQLEIQSIPVASGVGAQPLTDVETRQGARNRAQAVLQQNQVIDYALGLEGGVLTDELSGDLFSVVWVCAQDRQGDFREVSGAKFRLPDNLAAGLRRGLELKDAMFEHTGQADVNKKDGMIGAVTGGLITRTQEYQSLTKLALSLLITNYQ
jgi:inosine/xanthosine triphosphatase